MLQGWKSTTHTRQGPRGAIRLVHLLLLTLLVAGMVLPARAVYAQDAPVAPAAVNDIPIPVVTEQFEDAYLAAGLLYYSHYCFAGPTAAANAGEADAAADAPPSAPIQPAATDAFVAYLKRLPVNGGFSNTVATATGDSPTCYRYKLLTADADGVFYDVRGGDFVSETPLRVEFRPGGAGGEPVIVANTSPATYPIGERMASDATYIYWATPTGVVRARKDGTSLAPGPELVADGIAFPLDILVVGSTLYIADETGIFTIATSGAGACPAGGPCAETTYSSTGGTGLVYRFNRGLTFIQSANQIYWVAGTATTRRIHRRSCLLNPIIGGDPCSEGDVYSAPKDGLNWYFGRPAFYGSDMFWHEANYNMSTAAAQGFLRRMTLGGAPQTLASPISTNPDAVFVDGTNVYFSDVNFPNYAIKKLSVLAAPLTWNLQADALEVTQGIQNTANQAPLIAKKTTFVRAYGSNALGTRANNVTAWLYGTRGGSPLPGSPLKPTNGTQALFVGRTYDRVRLNDGWLFSLPSSWVASGLGAVTFRLVVDPVRVYTDPTPANNELSQALTFQPEAPACAIYVPVRTNNPKTSTAMPNFWDMVGRFQRLWPVPNMLNFTTGWQAEEVEVCWWGPFPHPCGGPFELNEDASISDWIPDRDEAIAQLWLFNVVNDAPACNSAGGYTHIMGMVHPSAPTGGTSGYASTVSAESWVKLPPASPNPFPNTWNGMRQSAVMAQELAHNYGRKHVNCGNPGGIDNSYPYTPCQIANTGPDSYYGFDSKTRTPISPTMARDYMAYGNNFWTSDYTWRAIRTSNAAAVASAASPNAGLIISANGTVLASGHLDTLKTLGQLNYVKVLPSGSMSSSMTQKLATVAVADYNAGAAAAQAASPDHEGQPDATNFHLRLIGANNLVLDDKAVSLVVIDDHDPNASAHVFVASFDAPAEQVVRVELLADNTVLDTLAPGVHAPVVTVSQPAAGATVQDSMTIAWNATDADNDPLVFTLQYSYDNGTTWQALTGDIYGTPDPANQLVLTELSGLRGSAANAARVRVIASDGFNTTIGTSAGFTLANRKPVPFITNPNGQTYDPQAVVMLEGGASDAEDGVLEGAALTWKIGATVVGSGSDAVLMGMAPGNYTATLEAKDTQNNLAAAGAPFSVAPLSVPLGSAATLDGACNDSTYAAGAQITLTPYGDAEQTQAGVRLIRDANYLYACFSGLKIGEAAPGAFAGLRFDVDNSRDAQAQATDYGFFVGESGSFFTYAGNGGGDFSQPGPGGLQAQISADGNGTTWNAELRIDKAVLGGWDHLVGMKAGHYWVGAQGDDYGWPYAAPTIALYNAPNTWARTVLGLQPIIDAVEPFSLTVGSPTTIITVTGQYFDANAEVLWNNTPLPTVSNAVAVAQTPEEAAAAAEIQQALAAGVVLPAEVTAPADALAISAATVLTAAVPSAQLASAGTATIAVRNAGQITSTTVSLAINNSTPVITTLGPAQTMAEGPTFTLTVNGSGFVNGAKVIWNGVELPTTFVGATQVKAQVSSALLSLGMQVSVTVRNPAPVAADSNPVQFNITPNPTLHLFLPTVKK